MDIKSEEQRLKQWNLLSYDAWNWEYNGVAKYENYRSRCFQLLQSLITESIKSDFE